MTAGNLHRLADSCGGIASAVLAGDGPKNTAKRKMIVKAGLKGYEEDKVLPG